ncbi:hypothetical protein Leryth_019909 [Lithospermum erythrorhizon]|nr:hypothetical protein Leryth_019909 [Lithospermum erythrorhizon]
MKQLSTKIHVPIISSHATISSFPQLHKCPHSFSSEIEAMVDMVQGFQWHEIIFLHQDSEPSNHFASQLVDAFRDKDLVISNKISISSSVTYFNTLKILTKISKTQTRIILVDVTDVTLGSRLVLAAKKVGLMSKGYAWLITSRMSTMLNSMDQNTLNVMEGALGIRPHLPIPSTLNSNMENIPRGHSGNSIHSDSQQNCFMSFEVFNILGKVERVVAIWSPDFGFSTDLGIIDDNDANDDDAKRTNSANSFKKITNSANNFKKIIWPGDSTMAPRSCDVPRAIRTRGPWRGI